MRKFVESLLSAKGPPIKIHPCLKNDMPVIRLHTNVAGT